MYESMRVCHIMEISRKNTLINLKTQPHDREYMENRQSNTGIVLNIGNAGNMVKKGNIGNIVNIGNK